jgi:TDG/mug DNA glycosylase family protein
MGVLSDILGPDLDVVFVGTSVGRESAGRGHYYSDPANSFYRDLHAAGFTDRLLHPEEDRLLLRYRIGLTDLAKHTVSSDDRGLAESNWDRSRLEETIRACSPTAVCFNGKKALKAWARIKRPNWGAQTSLSFGGIPIFVIPSTSGRVPSGKAHGGRTRKEWFMALRAWLANDSSAPEPAAPKEDDRNMTSVERDDVASAITADIVARFESERKAPYLDGDGYLVYGGRSGVHLVVYRRHNNPEPWTVPLVALREAVSGSCAAGRPFRAGECNCICRYRGTPLSILLQLVSADRYRAPDPPS